VLCVLFLVREIGSVTINISGLPYTLEKTGQKNMKPKDNKTKNTHVLVSLALFRPVL